MERTTKFRHAAISIGCMTVLIFVSVVLLGAQPHIPLIFGCLIAGIVAAKIGYSWDEILKGMTEGVSQALEAILILLLIGVLVGVWILSGTVPAMICYGMRFISADCFLPTASLLCLMVSFAIGAWGTVGTVGIAFMGIGQALGLPAPVVAGCIVSGSYCGEVISPLSDATNLTAAVVGTNIFDLIRKSLPLALSAFLAAEVLYFLPGTGKAASGTAADIAALTGALNSSFRVNPLSLLPLLLMILCILLKFPAIPSMLVGILSGWALSLLRGASLSSLLEASYSGYVSKTNIVLLDRLLSAGGILSMMNSISIVIIAMAFGGLMQHTGQMRAFIAPLMKHLRRGKTLPVLTALTCILTNLLLPDQYLGIAVPGQMYAQEYGRRGLSRLELGRDLLAGGAVTSPLIPWNTCGIYCLGILSVHPAAYLPYSFFNLLLPVLLMAVSLFPAPAGKK